MINEVRNRKHKIRGKKIRQNVEREREREKVREKGKTQDEGKERDHSFVLLSLLIEFK